MWLLGGRRIIGLWRRILVRFMGCNEMSGKRYDHEVQKMSLEKSMSRGIHKLEKQRAMDWKRETSDVRATEDIVVIRNSFNTT